MFFHPRLQLSKFLAILCRLGRQNPPAPALAARPRTNRSWLRRRCRAAGCDRGQPASRGTGRASTRRLLRKTPSNTKRCGWRTSGRQVHLRRVSPRTQIRSCGPEAARITYPARIWSIASWLALATSRSQHLPPLVPNRQVRQRRRQQQARPGGQSPANPLGRDCLPKVTRSHPNQARQGDDAAQQILAIIVVAGIASKPLEHEPSRQEDPPIRPPRPMNALHHSQQSSPQHHRAAPPAERCFAANERSRASSASPRAGRN